MTELKTQFRAIKKCPFCGGTPEWSNCVSCHYIMIRCKDCGAMINQVLKTETDEEVEQMEQLVLDKWNRRESGS